MLTSNSTTHVTNFNAQLLCGTWCMRFAANTYNLNAWVAKPGNAAHSLAFFFLLPCQWCSCDENERTANVAGK